MYLDAIVTVVDAKNVERHLTQEVTRRGLARRLGIARSSWQHAVASSSSSLDEQTWPTFRRVGGVMQLGTPAGDGALATPSRGGSEAASTPTPLRNPLHTPLGGPLKHVSQDSLNSTPSYS